MNQQKPKQLSSNDKAVIHLKTINDFNSRLASSCFDMCVKKYVTKKLDIDEQSCVDRCVFKYWETYKEVQEDMKNEMTRIQLREEMSSMQSNWVDDPSSRR